MVEETKSYLKTVKVLSREEFEAHINIAKKGWDENEWELEIVDRNDSSRYLVYEDHNSTTPFATFELTPYNPSFYTANKTSVEDVFSFKDIEQLKNADYNNVFEIDKFTILKENRSIVNLALVLIAILNVSGEMNAKSLVMLIRPSLFKILQTRFEVPIHRVGENVFYYSWLVPAIIDAELLVSEKKKYQIILEDILSRQ